jgi:hypothetical protein
VTLALENLVIEGHCNIPSRVKLPNVQELSLQDLISPRVLEFACACSNLISIFLLWCDTKSSLKILEAVGHNLKHIHIDFGGDDDDASVRHDLKGIFLMCPIVENLTLTSAQPKIEHNWSCLEKGLPFLKSFRLETCESLSNGMLRKLLCLKLFPKLVAIDFDGIDVSDSEFQQIISDLTLSSSSGRNFKKLELYGVGDRDMYLAFVKQIVHSFNISPGGLRLPNRLMNLERVKTAFKKMKSK